MLSAGTRSLVWLLAIHALACGSDGDGAPDGSGGSGAAAAGGGTGSGARSGGGTSSSGGAMGGSSSGGGSVGGSSSAGTAGAPPVLDGTWHELELVSDDDGDAVVLALGACGEGEALALWRRDGSPDDQLMAARFGAGASAWSTPVAIATGNRFDESTTKLAVNAACEALVVWVGPTAGADLPLLAATYDETGWSAPSEIAPALVSTLPNARIQVGISDSGEGVVAYVSEEYEAMHVDYAPGSGFAEPVALSPADADAVDLLLGMLPDGRAIQLFRQSGPANNERTAPTWLRATDGTWSAGPLLDATTTRVRLRPAGERFLLLSNGPGGNGYSIGSLSPSGELTPLPAPPELPLSNFGSGQSGIMSGNTDTAFVATSTNSGGAGYRGLKAARYDSANGWAAPASIDRNDLLGAYDIAVDKQGRALAYYATNNDDIVANRFTPEAGWSGPLLLSDTIFNSGGAHLAMDAGGNGVIAWAALGGSAFSISRGIVALRYSVDR